MANVIRLKRASGSDPAASDLVSGEPAVRTDTGELFFKKDDGSIAKVAGAGGGPDFKYLALRNAANNGAASYPNADFTLVTSGTTSAITPTAANTLLVSVNGVIQKPNTGTSTPSSGFALSGSTIKFGANISAAPDFILYQESGGIGEPSDDTVSEVKLKVSNSPVNGYFLSAQSGNNGGLTWAAPIATSCTGNSATATALETARAINGVNFDGTAAITVTAAAGTLTGNTLNSSVVTSSLTSLGDLSGLTVNGDMALTGANYNVLWDKSDNALEFADSAKAVFGTGSDLQIYHNGTDNLLATSGTVLAVHRATTNASNPVFEVRSNHGATNQIKFQVDGDGDVLIPTDTGKLQLGVSQDLQLYHDGSNSYLDDDGTGALLIRGSTVRIRKTGTTENMISCAADGAVELYYNNEKMFETEADGVKVFDNNESVHVRLVSSAGDAGFLYGASNTDIGLLTRDGSYAIRGVHDGKTELYFDGSKKLETTSSGVAITGGITTSGASTINEDFTFVAANGEDLRFDKSDSAFEFNDNFKCVFGNSSDLQIVHDGTNSSINNTTNDLRIESDRIELNNQASNEFYLTCTANGAVELYHNGSRKFRTHSSGAVFEGNLNGADDDKLTLGAADDLQIYHEAGFHSYIRETQNGNLVLWTNPSGTYSTIVLGAGQENSIICNKLGSVELYHISGVGSTSKKLETISGGVNMTDKLGINETSPVNLLTISTSGSQSDTVGMLQVRYTGTANANSGLTVKNYNGTSQLMQWETYGVRIGNRIITNSGEGNVFITAGNDSVRKQINADGHTNHFYTTAANPKEVYHWSNNRTGMSFRSANTERGNIFFFDSGVQFNTGSDYRLKENVTTISDGITRIKQLIPRKFNWIIDESNTPVDGFLAHEVSSIVPEAVNGTKDAVATQEDVDSGRSQKVGDPIHQMIDHSKLVPLLTAALQEAIGRIEALEAK